MSPPNDAADPRDFSRPAASLADLVVRQEDPAEKGALKAKAGDLTEELLKRRGTDCAPAEPPPPQDDAAHQDSDGATAQQTATVESPSDMQQPAPVTVQESKPEDIPLELSGDELAGDESSDSDEGDAAPAPPAVTGTDLRRKMMDAASGSDSGESTDDGDADAETPDAAKDGDATDASPKQESSLWRSKKKESETLLKSRMAAVLEKETRRREEWQARRSERPAVETPVPVVMPRPQPVINGDILRYWTSFRRGRLFPPLSAMDQEEIARHWPDSLLLRFTAGSNHLELARNFAKGPSDGDVTGVSSFRRIDFSPSVIDWVVSQGLAAAYEENPVRATEEFDTHWGTGRYKVIALPLAEDGKTIDHILCHLEPAGPND